MSHPCPGPGEVHAPGQDQVDDDMLACSRHWYQVDGATRSRVWRLWERSGHLDSAEHSAALIEAVGQMTELRPPKPRRARS